MEETATIRTSAATSAAMSCPRPRRGPRSSLGGPPAGEGGPPPPAGGCAPCPAFGGLLAPWPPQVGALYQARSSGVGAAAQPPAAAAGGRIGGGADSLPGAEQRPGCAAWPGFQ